MTRAGLCRRAARALVAAAVWISPANMREWAAAMAAESEYVEGSFGALAWAAGCFGTAVRQLCISILSPEAVQWDQNLTWVYSYMLAAQIGPEHHDPNDARWLASLQAWAPDNAAVDAIEASYYRPHGVRGLNPQADRALLAASPRWLSAMKKAFSATNYDSYLSASRELERHAAGRNGVMELGNAPVMLWGAVNSYVFEEYAKNFLLPAGADFEAKGDFKHAEESYARVSHLSALIQFHSASDSEMLAASELQLAVDPKLEALYEKSGNSAAAQFVAY